MTAPHTSIGIITGRQGDQTIVPITLLEDCSINGIELSISFLPEKTKFIRWISDNDSPPEATLEIVQSPNKPSRNTMSYKWMSPDGGNIDYKAGTILFIGVFEYVFGNSKLFFEKTGDEYSICEYTSEEGPLENEEDTYIDGYAVIPPTLW